MIVHADLHIHSWASDGEAHPSEIVRYARRVGLHVISVTDHDTFAGSVLARAAAGSGGPIVVFGAEFRTEWGDVLVLCEEPIPLIRNPYVLRDLANSFNCLLIPAHPFDIMRLGIGWRIREQLWDSIECFNMGSDPVTNLASITYCRLHRVSCLANSDAHVLSMIGPCRTLIEVDELSAEDVLESIRKGLTHPRPYYSITGLSRKLLWGLKRKVIGFRRPVINEELYLSIARSATLSPNP